MQEMGSAATTSAADAVLQGNFGEVAAAVVVARRARLLVMSNIALACFMNIAFMAVASLPDSIYAMPLWLSVMFDNASLLLVLANSLWPLCWHVATAKDLTESTATGGKLTYKERKRGLQALDEDAVRLRALSLDGVKCSCMQMSQPGDGPCLLCELPAAPRLTFLPPSTCEVCNVDCSTPEQLQEHFILTQTLTLRKAYDGTRHCLPSMTKDANSLDTASPSSSS